MIERRVDALPSLGNVSNAEKKAAAFRVGDACLAALCNATNKETKAWALRVRATARELTWADLREGIESELIPEKSAERAEGFSNIIGISQRLDESVADFLSRLLDAVSRLEVDNMDDGTFSLGIVRALALRGLRDQQLERRMQLAVCTGKCESWKLFSAVLKAEAGAAWTALPKAPVVRAWAGPRVGLKPASSRGPPRTEERSEHQKKGLCFYCSQPGQPSRATAPTSPPTASLQRRRETDGPGRRRLAPAKDTPSPGDLGHSERFGGAWRFAGG